MRMFRIRVNGNEYEVEVEEITSPPENSPAMKTAADTVRQQQTIEPAARQVARPASAPAPVREGAETIAAPMPGTIVDILVQAGAQVKSGQTLIILEAMKMQNEIHATHDCTVAEVQVAKGASVNAGDVLIVLS
jgi:glutaconyl-CoA/methylmalonyl-CoA decarboxylase subunit gamma